MSSQFGISIHLKNVSVNYVMENVLLFLIRLGLFELTLKTVFRWRKKQFLAGLDYAWEQGTHILKSEVAKAFGERGDKSSLSKLQNGINSSFMDVSIASVRAYQEVCDFNKLLITPDTTHLIRLTHQKWQTHILAIRSQYQGTHTNREQNQNLYIDEERTWARLIGNLEEKRGWNNIPI